MKTMDKGVTLVALVITIILMLILAVVTTFAINQGRLFEYAKEAKVSTDNAAKTEEIGSAYLVAKGVGGTDEEIMERFQASLKEMYGEDAEAIENEGGITIKIGDKYYSMDSAGNVSKDVRTMDVIAYPGDLTKGGTCTGSESNPYKIECIEDLVAFSKNVRGGNKYRNKYVVITKDLDFNSIFSYADYKTKYIYNSTTVAYEPDEESATTLKELCTTGQGFIPIGTTDNSFQGVFDGQNHIFKNIHIERSGQAALFIRIYKYEATGLKNLTIDGHIVSTGATAVGFVIEGSGDYLTNCINKAKIEGKTHAAGIIGTDNLPVTRCVNEGEIIAHSPEGENMRAAGISCEFNNTISKCYNKGTVTNEGGTISGAAGICGRSTAGNKTVSNCYNIANIKSISGTAGGITCWSEVIIQNCCNTGNLSGKASATRGGVARNNL